MHRGVCLLQSAEQPTTATGLAAEHPGDSQPPCAPSALLYLGQVAPGCHTRSFPKMRICMLLEQEAREAEQNGVHREDVCRSSRHHHCSRGRADELVNNYQALWVGKHKRKLQMLVARTWVKTYERNRAGEVRGCSLQLTDRFAALFIPSRRQDRRVKPGPVRELSPVEA